METASPTSSEGLSRADIEAQLQRLLCSSYFRGSRRCREFLSYVVTRTLEGDSSLLHERVLGMDLFGRPSSYDPSEDSIVRANASEVRKKLAQYYADPKHQCECRIELPLGRYVPEFCAQDSLWREVEAQAVGPPAPVTVARGGRRKMNVAIACMLLPLGFIALIAVYRLGHPRSPVDEFWGAVRKTGKPVMITLGHARVYELSASVYREYFKTHPRPDDTLPIKLDADFTLRADDLIPRQGDFVGTGGAQAVLRFASLLGGMGKACTLRTGIDFSYADLRSQPSILLGAFSYRWSPLLTKDLRFQFTTVDGVGVIRDAWHPGQVWKLTPGLRRRDCTDYALISRILRSKTGDLLIIAAGINHYGTASAAEFLTEPLIFTRGLKDAPADWQTKNIQIVIRSNVVEGTPGPPEVVARHFW